jgi:predicted transcriptional regulator
MNDTIKLTVRQKIFLIRLVEVFSKTRQPVHHIALAKVLGLSKSTTYDMLKLLESRRRLKQGFLFWAKIMSRKRKKKLRKLEHLSLWQEI